MYLGSVRLLCGGVRFKTWMAVGLDVNWVEGIGAWRGHNCTMNIFRLWGLDGWGRVEVVSYPREWN